MRSRITHVICTIFFILMFQIVSLIALEMNVYIVTDGDDSSNAIPMMSKQMEELKKLNDMKPKFMMQFGNEHQSTDFDGKIEFPGA